MSRYWERRNMITISLKIQHQAGFDTARQAATLVKIRAPTIAPRPSLCCAVLCCAVLCCAVLCCAVLCCAVLCCAVLCCAVLCCAVLCCAVLCCAVLCCAVLLISDKPCDIATMLWKIQTRSNSKWPTCSNYWLNISIISEKFKMADIWTLFDLICLVFDEPC